MVRYEQDSMWAGGFKLTSEHLVSKWERRSPSRGNDSYKGTEGRKNIRRAVHGAGLCENGKKRGFEAAGKVTRASPCKANQDGAVTYEWRES